MSAVPFDYAKRAREIVERHTAGETLTSIGKDYGLSSARVRQIVEKEKT